MKHSIIITTINEPTQAVIAFSKIPNYKLIIVSDKKTPCDWYLDDVDILDLEKQSNLDFQLSRFLPYNHYSRKNLGYLYAIQQGSEIIVDTDDDNIPNLDWDILKFEGCYNVSFPDLGFVNIYKCFTDLNIWPRGFPLDKVTKAASTIQENQILKNVYTRVGIWQGLANGDPDVDAIYRLILNVPCYFRESPPIVLGKGTICPFNSQNTAFLKPLFPLLYLPSLVTFRYTDILRGLVAQPILWNSDYYLGFTSSTVTQERNFHDYMKDFELEIPCYLEPYKVINAVLSSVKASFSISDNLYQAYTKLHQIGIVQKEELTLLNYWLEDIAKLS